MGLAPHDLVWLRSLANLVSEVPRPAWVAGALARAPLVVVRRAPWVAGLVPIGVRGWTRGERYAAFLSPGAIVERITPEQLAGGRGWRVSPRIEEVWALRTLEKVEAVFTSFGFAWGPVGSVGFELASGIATCTASSDLDLVVRAPQPLPLGTARQLCSALSAAPVRVDVQVEMPNGAVALSEYARGGPLTLLRTPAGPRLVADPWAGVRAPGVTA